MLPQVPVLLPDESVPSLLLRASEANGWNSLSRLLGALVGESYASGVGSLRAIITRPVRLAKIAQAIGTDESAFVSAGYHHSGATQASSLRWRGIQIESHHLRLAAPAVCPACLKDDGEWPYSRALWDHRFVRSCETHKLKLHDTCPSCRSPITWIRERLCFCGCGFDFRDAIQAPASAAEHALLAGTLSSGNRAELTALLEMLETIEEWRASNALQPVSQDSTALLAQLVSEPDSLPTVLRTSNAPGDQNVSARLALRRLFVTDAGRQLAVRLLGALERSGQHFIVGDWQTILATTITRPVAGLIFGTSTTNAKSLTSALAQSRSLKVPLHAVDKCLKACHPQSQDISPDERVFQASRKTYTHVLKAMATGRGRSLGYSLTKGLWTLRAAVKTVSPIPTGFTTPAGIAVDLLVHTDSISALCRRKFLPYKEVTIEGYRRRLISNQDASAFKNEYCFVGRIAKVHGAHPARFAEQLMHHGIKPVSGPRIDGGMTYLFRTADLAKVDLRAVAQTKKYMSHAGRKMGAAKSRNPDAITIAEAGRILGCPPASVRGLSNRGHLPPPLGKSYEGMFVSKKGVELLHKNLCDPSFISVEEAEQALGESPTEFRIRWQRSGRLKIKDLGLRRVVSRRSVEDILQLKRDYMTSSDAAKAMGFYKGHLHNRRAIGTLKAAMRIGRGPRALLLYRRIDVTKYCGMPIEQDETPGAIAELHRATQPLDASDPS